jgi:hypothetical protein
MRDLIAARGALRIDELARDFGVSEMTIRRDLDELEALGFARRVRGGAIALGPEPWEQRHQHNARAKSRIADKLLPMVPASGTVAFDASTTIYRLAASLETARDLVVVTNGWDTFQSMKGTPGVTASLTGGTEESRTGSLVGPMAVRAAKYQRHIRGLTPDAIALLQQYSWPGNIRELRNVLERVHVETVGDVIGRKAFLEWVEERSRFYPGSWDLRAREAARAERPALIPPYAGSGRPARPMLYSGAGEVIDVVPQQLDPSTSPAPVAEAIDITPEPPREITRERLEHA